MTRLATTERAALCDTALEVGEDAATLCEGWTVSDLVAHLLVREGSPAAVGITVPALAGLTAAATRRVQRRSFPAMVERLRGGPPRLSPFALPRVDELANTLELFVHHEDVRRAQPGWEPRVLGDRSERTLWSMLGTPGKALTRRTPVGVSVRNATTGGVRVLKAGPPAVTVVGLPSELALFLFGRGAQARVELLGDELAVARLRDAELGV
jgi:uncharacterized protein (TIGR03085 family)